MDGRVVGVDLLGYAPDWQERALCAQTDPEAFFPEKGGSTREAKRICSRCEVRTECLEYALEHEERFGIWGGMSERERRRLKHRGGQPRRDSPRVTRIRRMAKAGMDYAEMAREEGIEPDSVGAVCRQHDIEVLRKRGGDQARKPVPVGGGAQ